jgi:hypothetical protein
MIDPLDNEIKVITDNFISADVRINCGSSLSPKRLATGKTYILAFRVEPTAGEDWHFVDIWVSEGQLRYFIKHAKRVLDLTSNRTI